MVPVNEGLNLDMTTFLIQSHPKAMQLLSRIRWMNLIVIASSHLFILFGYQGPITFSALIFQIIMFFILGSTLTIGTHRYFAHQTFKAKKPLRHILTFLQTASMQYPIINWVRDHRAHHKFSDTDGDPYTARGSFFYAHIGWFFLKKSQEVFEAGKKIDISDVENDKILQFQKRYYYPLAAIIYIFITWVTTLFGVTFMQALYVNVFRSILINHLNFAANSFCHKFGSKPYDKYSSATDTVFWGIAIFGEGWHNFHHVFPTDYKTSEYNYFNFSSFVIRQFAKFGWVYDLKETPKEAIEARALKSGDGSRGK